jgi:cell volume regulation protein A
MISGINYTFLIVAAIIILGFLGDVMFKKAKVPSFIFLILAGVLLGPVFKLVSQNALLPFLGIFAELTLIMVLFHGGIDLRLTSILKEGWRAFLQVFLYVGISVVLISFLVHFVLGWPFLLSLIFGSIVGGETTVVVIFPLVRALKLKSNTITFLSLEAALNSVVLVILFITFVGLYQTGSLSLSGAIDSLVSNFSIGIILGLILSLLWLYLLNLVKRNEFAYVLTLGLLFLTFSLTNVLGGSGFLAVLIFGLVIGNHSFISSMLKRRVKIRALERQIFTLQGELSFLLRTFFFVFLGLILSLSYQTALFGAVFGLAIVAVLMFSRTIAASISTFRSEIAKDKGLILVAFAQGTTPATLAILALSYNLPLSGSFLTLVTYIIIFTNIITTVGAFSFARKRGSKPEKLMSPKANKV